MHDSSCDRRLRTLVLGGALLGLMVAPAAAQSSRSSDDPDQLAPRFREFLEVAEVLLTRQARREFRTLTEDYQRDQFVEAFWQGLDPTPDDGNNEFRERWLARVEFVREEWESAVDPRSQAFLLNGMPHQVVEEPCTLELWPLEIWVYEDTERLGRVVLVFVDVGKTGRRYELWTAYDDAQRLSVRPLDSVGGQLSGNLNRLSRWLAAARSGPGAGGSRRLPLGISDVQDVGFGQGALIELLGNMMESCFSENAAASLLLESVGMEKFKPHAQQLLLSASPDLFDDEARWLPTFRARSTDIPRGSRGELGAEVQWAFPARRGLRTVVEGTVLVPVGDLGVVTEPEPVHRFVLNGDVLRATSEGDSELFESFQVRFEVPVSLTAERADSLPLTFRRLLRPGEFQIVLRLEDAVAERHFRATADLTVPEVSEVETAQRDERVESALDRAAVELAETESGLGELMVRLRLEDPGQAMSGLQRVEAELDGAPERFEEVRRMSFELDGQPRMSRSRAPFSVELDFGPIPRPQILSAVATDENGEELARTDVEINRGRYAFTVRLLEPREGVSYVDSVPVRADVRVPDDQTLDRVELMIGEQTLATLYQEPFEQRLPLPVQGLALVRVVAHLADGNTAEDVVFVNAPGASERIRVHLVELYASAREGGRSVDDLERDEVRVSENGEPQEILRFERTEDLPLHLAVLLDTSGSMADRLDEARAVALRFFERSVRPRDRIAVVTFHERPSLRVDFTSDLEAMRKGLRYLAAGQGTAFFDSVVFALYQFQGMKGQRALLLVTDGRDQDSRFTFEDTLEYARRAGVTVYPVGLKGVGRNLAVRQKLNRLAAETGGEAFYVQEVEELDAVYDRIERQLRSRYLITYQSTVSEGDLAYRSVEVGTSRPGVEIDTVAGYYP